MHEKWNFTIMLMAEKRMWETYDIFIEIFPLYSFAQRTEACIADFSHSPHTSSMSETQQLRDIKHNAHNVTATLVYKHL